MLGRWRWLLAPAVALAGILFFSINPATAGVLDATWTAPTTNTDGSQLTDLSFYRVYYGTSATPCPSGILAQERPSIRGKLRIQCSGQKHSDQHSGPKAVALAYFGFEASRFKTIHRVP